MKQSEDCLYLDIHAPTIDRSSDSLSSAKRLFPVMVWIHGGAFIIGSGRSLGAQDPSYIVQHKDVIVVSINYRLGPLGFMVTGEAKGNYGFLDQRFALEWIQRNIEM